MKKWILIGVSIVVILVVVLVIGLSKLGPIIKNGVNTYGPDITKTEMRLNNVDVSLFSAKAKLEDFFLGNPKGFKSPQAMKVGSILVDVNESSLTKDTIIIDRIEVIAPEITYEKISGTDNFMTILDNVKKSIGSGEDSQKKEATKTEGGKKILIKNFIVKDGKVSLVMPMLAGKSISTPLPNIHLKDIGKKKEGASPAEVSKEIFAEIYKKITSPAVTGIFNDKLKSLGVNLDSLGESAKKQVETLKGTVGKDTQDKVKSVTGKLKGLLSK